MRHLLFVSLIASFVVIASNTNARADVLVTSSESHSIERFSNSGAWMSTFASTGARVPEGIAQSPTTGLIYATTLTNQILRFNPDGTRFGFWDTLTVPGSPNFAASVVFDAAGDLWTDTDLGTGGYTVVIYEYAAASLSHANPAPIVTITTSLMRGGQLALNPAGNICIASFASETVQCFDQKTGVLVFDYGAEIAASGISPNVEPVGVQFFPNGKILMNSTFAAQVIKETGPPRTGPLVLLASGLIPLDDYLTYDGSGNVYEPSFSNAAGLSTCTGWYWCQNYDFSQDVIWKINTATGAKFQFISTHIYGPYQMIFATVT